MTKKRFTTREAELAADICWNGVKQMMASERAAQDAIAGTAEDFEIFARDYLVRCLVFGSPIPLEKRIDAQRGTATEEVTGDYHFDKIENLEQMTYTQMMMALQTEVPYEYRIRAKRLKADGLTPWQAYSQVKREYEVACNAMEIPETPAAEGDPTVMTDAKCRQLLNHMPAEVTRHYEQLLSKHAVPAVALETAMRAWRGEAA